MFLPTRLPPRKHATRVTVSFSIPLLAARNIAATDTVLAAGPRNGSGSGGCNRATHFRGGCPTQPELIPYSHISTTSKQVKTPLFKYHWNMSLLLLVWMQIHRFVVHCGFCFEGYILSFDHRVMYYESGF